MSGPKGKGPPARPARTAAKKTTKKAGYPRYERSGDKLVKVGWSKKHKDQYEHRAPRAAVIAVARQLSGQVKANEVFEVPDILPVADPSGGEVPSYQVYLVLGWLRDAGAIEKKGRDGYVLRDGSIGGEGLDRLWGSLKVQAA